MSRLLENKMVKIADSDKASFGQKDDMIRRGAKQIKRLKSQLKTTNELLNLVRRKLYP